MKTAVQELFSKLEKEHPNLFNVHSVDGREFINSYYYILEMEKKQMKDAVLQQCTKAGFLRDIFEKQFEKYYKETFKPETTN
jgi:hypothetical protein